MEESKTVICIYTSVFGDYDTIKEPCAQSVPVDFKVFTESHDLGSPRLEAKYYKLHPPEGYDYTIWVDGSVKITSRFFAEYMVGQAKDKWALFQHPWRDCIYEEAKEAHDMAKYLDQPIMKQVESYRREGMPEHYGMPSCGIIARSKWGKEINEAWWEENLKWTIKDQVSFPYVLWKQKKSVYICSEPLFGNGYFQIHANHRAGEYKKCQQS